MRKFKPFIPESIKNAVIPIPPNCPLDVEIGCGVGWHPLTYAQKHPERFLVAIEHTQEKFAKFQQRYLAHGSPPNLSPLHANAISWLACHIKPGQIDRILLLYPNPHPKPSQLNQRWYAMPFMGFLKNCLKPHSGEIILATNMRWYADGALEMMVHEWGFVLKDRQELSLSQGLPDGFPRTHFEKKYLLAGETCFNLVFSPSI